MNLPQPVTPGPWRVVYSDDGHMDGVRNKQTGLHFRLVEGANSMCLTVAELLNQAEALQ